MHSRYFPPCPIDGPIAPPVPFAHFSLRGAVPKKCSECKFQFEGSCCRYLQDVGRDLHLDHGPCGIEGPTDPVVCEHKYIRSKVEIPRKCVKCFYLSCNPIDGFICTKDADKWGHFHRGLDWGTWTPDYIYLEFLSSKVATKELTLYARQNDRMSFIKEHRRINPGLSIQEAIADFADFRERLERLG